MHIPNWWSVLSLVSIWILLSFMTISTAETGQDFNESSESTEYPLLRATKDALPMILNGQLTAKDILKARLDPLEILRLVDEKIDKLEKKRRKLFYGKDIDTRPKPSSDFSTDHKTARITSKHKSWTSESPTFISKPKANVPKDVADKSTLQDHRLELEDIIGKDNLYVKLVSPYIANDRASAGGYSLRLEATANLNLNSDELKLAEQEGKPFDMLSPPRDKSEATPFEFSYPTTATKAKRRKA